MHRGYPATLARNAEIVRRRFGVGYTLAGLDPLLHRAGWSIRTSGLADTMETRFSEPTWNCWGVRSSSEVALPVTGFRPFSTTGLTLSPG
jgi:Winged helix-turn helix